MDSQDIDMRQVFADLPSIPHIRILDGHEFPHVFRWRVLTP
jgi:hypothetical protein